MKNNLDFELFETRAIDNFILALVGDKIWELVCDTFPTDTAFSISQVIVAIEAAGIWKNIPLETSVKTVKLVLLNVFYQTGENQIEIPNEDEYDDIRTAESWVLPAR